MTLADHLNRKHLGPNGTFVARIEEICPAKYLTPTGETKPQPGILSRWKGANKTEESESAVVPKSEGTLAADSPDSARSDATYSNSPYLAPAPKTPRLKTLLESPVPDEPQSPPVKPKSGRLETMLEAVPLDPASTADPAPSPATATQCDSPIRWPAPSVTQAGSNAPGDAPRPSLFADHGQTTPSIPIGLGDSSHPSEESQNQSRLPAQPYAFQTLAALLVMVMLTALSCGVVLGIVWAVTLLD